MAQYSTDSTGIYYYIDLGASQGLKGTLFDKAAATKQTGWSEQIKNISHVKTANETTGQITSKHTG